ncbi:Kinesin associated protein [Blomia tropicalis]|nr:Kinesin associated protein [Blomia tropicalis]
MSAGLFRLLVRETRSPWLPLNILDKLELSQSTSYTNDDQILSEETHVQLEENNFGCRTIVSSDILPDKLVLDHQSTVPLDENIVFCKDRSKDVNKEALLFEKSSNTITLVGTTPETQHTEVELISLIEEKIPNYKLRIDTITDFVGYQHNDWLIKTPLIDLEAPVDLNPTILRETFNLFIQSGERLSQMTRVYNDIDALTKLLEEITQLKHEISSKKELLEIYFKREEDEDEEYNSLNDTSLSSYSSASPQKSAKILSELEKRVGTLETENKKLKSDTVSRTFELEREEKKELHLIGECARQLKDSNKQIHLLQEDLNSKNDDNARMRSEIAKLTSQVANLEKKIRKLTIENEELESALHLAQECQSELSIELIDVKEQHNVLLNAFHDKQEECRQLTKRNSLTDSLFPYVNSLAFELDQSIQEGSVTNLDGCEDAVFPAIEPSFNQCTTPDSLLSNDSYYTSSPFTSFNGASTSVNNELSKSQCSISSNTITLPSSNASSPSVESKSRTIFRHHHFMSDKLRYIKPIEGSQILNHWRRLASPNLNNLLEDKEKYISRIKANMVASEMKVSSSLSKERNTTNRLPETAKNSSHNVVQVSLVNNFVTTNSVFTFTTTSLSQTRESVTHVTSTFSNVRPSTGKCEYSVILHSTQNQSNHQGDRRNSTPVCLVPAQPRVSQAKADMRITSAKENQRTTTTTTTMSRNINTPAQTQFTCEGNGQLKLEPFNGLNELSKLLEKDSIGRFSSIKPLNQNRRIITKVMANANDQLGLSNVAKSDFFRTDLSVLRNLRKGGLI